MDKPTEEQIKEFWEWCGFARLPKGGKGYHYEQTVKIMNWLPPNKTEVYASIPYLPTLDLNNLFKYAVPKLQELGWGCRVQSSPLRDNDEGKIIFDWSGYAEVFYTKYDKPLSHKNSHYAINNNPALALFWAIWEVIHG